MATHGFRYAHLYMTAGPRTDSPPAPSGGTRAHGPGPLPKVKWEDEALCRGGGNHYGNVWLYPSIHEPEVVHAACKVCERCPVKAECLAAAHREGVLVGIRAGRAYGAGNDNGKPLVECVVCGELFKAHARAKCCSAVCRLDWGKRQKKAYDARTKGGKSTRSRPTGEQASAIVEGAAQNGEETGSVGTAPAPSEGHPDTTGGPLVTILSHPPARVKSGPR
jgi:hypothetical protein